MPVRLSGRSNDHRDHWEPQHLQLVHELRPLLHEPPAIIPLVPRTARTIDERATGAILLRRDGSRLDPRTALPLGSRDRPTPASALFTTCSEQLSSWPGRKPIRTNPGRE
jgi:hypothetical protein